MLGLVRAATRYRDKSRRERNMSPASRSIKFVCLPIQPSPALRASAFSRTGALSVNARWPNGPTRSRMRSQSLCSRGA